MSNLVWSPITHVKNVPVPEGGTDLLIRQPSLLTKLQASERPQKNQGRQHPRKDSPGCSLSSTSMFIHMRVHLCTHIYIYTYLHLYTHALCTYIHTRTSMHIHKHASVHIWIYAHACGCTHTKTKLPPPWNTKVALRPYMQKGRFSTYPGTTSLRMTASCSINILNGFSVWVCSTLGSWTSFHTFTNHNGHFFYSWLFWLRSSLCWIILYIKKFKVWLSHVSWIFCHPEASKRGYD